jgi:hypothetical protein
MKTKQSLLLLLVTLLIASMACSLVGGASDPTPVVDVPIEEPVAEESGEAEAAGEAADMEESEAEAEEADTEAEDADAEDTDSADHSGDDYDTEFPLPEDVQNFMGGEGTANFATSLTVEEATAFYRDALGAMGLTERTINTSITETTFSMVFDGHENGKAVVVQAVDLGNGTTNINIRFEDV